MSKTGGGSSIYAAVAGCKSRKTTTPAEKPKMDYKKIKNNH